MDMKVLTSLLPVFQVRLWLVRISEASTFLAKSQSDIYLEKIYLAEEASPAFWAKVDCLLAFTLVLKGILLPFG